MTMEIKTDYSFRPGGLAKGFIYRLSNDNSCYANDSNTAFFLTAFFSGIKAKDGRIAQLIGGYFCLMVC